MRNKHSCVDHLKGNSMMHCTLIMLFISVNWRIATNTRSLIICTISNLIKDVQWSVGLDFDLLLSLTLVTLF